LTLLRNRNIEVQLIDLTSQNAFEQVKDYDGVMWRYIHTATGKVKAYKIMQTIEKYLKIPVFPNCRTAWHYDDKLIQYYIFKALNIPPPENWIFYNISQALEWLKKTEYPVVFKLSSGASAENVILVESYRDAKDLAEEMFLYGVFSHTLGLHKKKHSTVPSLRKMLFATQYCLRYLHHSMMNLHPRMFSNSGIFEKGFAYFQEYIPFNEYDTRITVIGNRAFGYRRYNRSNDFRASGSPNRDFNEKDINLECVKIAFEASKKLKAQSMAYDFLNKNGRPVITEMSYTFVDILVKKCPGYWIPDLEFVPKSMWPEEAQIEDFVNYIETYRK